MSPDDLPFVSIIIPVFNQGAELLRCLAALSGQTYHGSRFEVVVVDNASDRPVAPLTQAFPFARCVREPKPGSYAARNRGIEASRGEILGFTDADCVPAANWIERGVCAVQRLAGAGMVAGKIELTLHDPGKPTAAELFESIFGFPQDTYVKWGFGATANLFTTRATVDKVGLFDDSLMSGGDMEWGQRLRSRGLVQEYADDQRVSHSARRTLGQLLRKSVRVAGGVQQVADRRGQGTAGLPVHARQQLVQLQRIRANLSDERLDSVSRKLRFAAVVWLVELSQTLERYRVHCGGASWRT